MQQAALEFGKIPHPPFWWNNKPAPTRGFSASTNKTHAQSPFSVFSGRTSMTELLVSTGFSRHRPSRRSLPRTEMSGTFLIGLSGRGSEDVASIVLRYSERLASGRSTAPPSEAMLSSPSSNKASSTLMFSQSTRRRPMRVMAWMSPSCEMAKPMLPGFSKQ